jgi:threonine/homoserine efflux transporter RhtA
LRAVEQPPGSASEPLRLESVWMRRATWLFFTTILALLAVFGALKGWVIG